MSGSKNGAIFAVYPTHASAEAALNTLRASGFAAADISFVAPHGTAALTTTGDVVEAPPESAPNEPGAINSIGAAINWLAGLGAVAVSGAMYVAAGPIMATFKGMSDALLGIVDALMRFGIPADTAKNYEERVRAGATLVSVHAEDLDRLDKGKEIFEQTGAEDITSTYEAHTVDRPGLTVPHTN